MNDTISSIEFYVILRGLFLNLWAQKAHWTARRLNFAFFLNQYPENWEGKGRGREGKGKGKEKGKGKGKDEVGRGE